MRKAEHLWDVDRGLRRFAAAVFHPLGWGLAQMASPNSITVLSAFISAAVGYFFAVGRFFLGAWLMLAAGLLDIWDGQVAKLTGRVSVLGAFLDSTVDRASDMFYSLGALYFFVSDGDYDVAVMIGGYVFLSTMISYVKARAEGLGLACSGGLLARPLRMLLFGFPLFVYGVLGNLWVFRGSLILCLLLGIETLSRRLLMVVREARRSEDGEDRNGPLTEGVGEQGIVPEGL